MNKKRIVLIVIIIITCFVGYIFYSYFKPPTEFLKDKALMEEISRYDNSLQPQKIVDQIKLNERHYFVPIQFSDGRSGMSFWKWERGKWQLIQFTTGRILRWQLDKRDAATNYIVWHGQKTQEDELSIYLVKDRNFGISNDEHQYDPKIQLGHTIQMNAYGVEQLPNEWATIIATLEQPNKQSGLSLFDSYFTGNYRIMAHYDDSMFSGNSGYSYWTGNAQSTIEFLMYMDKYELE